jgi:hypothetical protein
MCHAALPDDRAIPCSAPRLTPDGRPNFKRFRKNSVRFASEVRTRDEFVAVAPRESEMERCVGV